jgi:hypothetical protein
MWEFELNNNGKAGLGRKKRGGVGYGEDQLGGPSFLRRRMGGRKGPRRGGMKLVGSPYENAKTAALLKASVLSQQNL